MKKSEEKPRKWEKPEMKVLSIKKTYSGPAGYTYENAFYNDFS